MSRTVLMKVLILAALACLAASPAMAVVSGTAHDAGTAAGAQGICSPCHLPHTGQTAERLWPVAPTTGLAPGVTASLCASCHYATGAYQTVTAFADARATSSNIYTTYSHGVQMLIADIPPGNNLAGAAAAGLPYTTGTNIECTSCHNVHDDATARPFLRLDMDTLCATCHNAGTGTQGRQFVGGSLSTAVGAWDRANYLEELNPGSHPVGTDITEANADAAGDNPITFPTEFAVLKPATSGGQTVGNWSLGGHLRNADGTGGMTCNTCHAVHGLDQDGETTGQAAYTSLDPTLNMLVRSQTGSAEGTTSGRSIASGDGDAGNNLCEACHVGGTVPDGSAAGYAGSRIINPGATDGTHPVDDYIAVNEALSAYSGIFTDAPVSSTASIGGSPQNPICETCHTPHPAAWNPASPAEGRTTIASTAGTYILRASNGTICAQCHTTALTRHHPVNVSLGTALSTGAASYLTTGYPGMSTSNLDCATCHIGSGAHNWSGQSGVGLNTNWRPTNNARMAAMADDRYAAGTNDVTTENVSATCVDCHLDIDSDSANVSPTLHNGSSVAGETEYTNLGGGSHYIGPINTAFFASNPIRSGSNSINVSTDAWTTTIFGTGNANGGWSRFGGTSTAPILVCESCHDLEPDKNVGNHMLLANFLDGQSETLSYASGYDDFCEACHAKPTGTHPMTADTVGRTSTTLNVAIDTVNRPWLAALAPNAVPAGGSAGTSTWSGTSASDSVMTCDSCHQIHDANTQGGSLSLEAPNANITGGTPAAITSSNYYGGNPISRRLREKAPAGGSTGVGTMPDVSMFCDQCHTYRQ